MLSTVRTQDGSYDVTLEFERRGTLPVRFASVKDMKRADAFAKLIELIAFGFPKEDKRLMGEKIAAMKFSQQIFKEAGSKHAIEIQGGFLTLLFSCQSEKRNILDNNRSEKQMKMSLLRYS